MLCPVQLKPIIPYTPSNGPDPPSPLEAHRTPIGGFPQQQVFGRDEIAQATSRRLTWLESSRRIGQPIQNPISLAPFVGFGCVPIP